MLPGRDQIGRVAAIKLERMTEFALEYPAGFVGIRRPVRRLISRIGIPSRKCQRRITLNNAMSITP